MKKFLAFILLPFILTSSAFAEEPLVIRKQGVFSSGGTVTEPLPGNFNVSENWRDFTRAGNTSHVDHANTFYQIPDGENSSPIVYLHGYGQTRKGWQPTPDGREVWSDIFLLKGRAAFLVDQPRRGAAGNTVSIVNNEQDTRANATEFNPGDQAWYTHFKIGRGTPTDVRKITGKKAVYLTHSQGGRVGWQTDTENIAAIVAIDPGFTPEVGSDNYKKFVAAKIPMVFYFGDYIENGPDDIQSTAFWKSMLEQCRDFAEHYNEDGGDATVTGSSHITESLAQKPSSSCLPQNIIMGRRENCCNVRPTVPSGHITRRRYVPESLVLASPGVAQL